MNYNELFELGIKFIPSILSFIACFISIIIVCKKNKSRVSSCLLGLFIKLPSFIKDAEIKGFATGEAKSNYVLQLSISYISSNLDITYEEAFTKYKNTVSLAVEDILDTPEKK